MLRHLVEVVTVALGLSLASGPLQAQQFLDSMSKDFGSVPRGTLLTHQFRLHNPTTSPLRVAGIRTSCNCTAASLLKYELQPGESTSLVVTVDTNKFSGFRTFTVFLSLDRPFLAEWQILLTATSRDDVTLTPGQLQFGRVRFGSSAKASVLVEYFGGGNWEILGVENDNGYLLPELRKLERPSGQKAYQLEVKLRDDIPVGFWHAELFLKTNDASAPRIRVPLVVEVEGQLTATPGTVAFGSCKPGTTAEKRVVIRGKEAFRIVRLEGCDDQVRVSGIGEEAKSVHVLTVTLAPSSASGEFVRRIRVITDLGKGENVDFLVQAVIVP